MVNNKKKVLIVGGGTSGLIIANRIQEYFDVTVIEKSKFKKYPIFFKIPLLIGLLLRRKKTKYISKRDFTLNDGRKLPFFESNLLGGASVINGCVHMLGSKTQWNTILNKFNSNYFDLIKSYEDLYSKDSKSKNKIILSNAYQNVIDKSFIKALKSINFKIGNMDYSDNEACGAVINTTKKYFRSSVLSIIDDKSFNILMGENVEKILFDNNNKVTGLKTNMRILEADFIILSGGVIGTCDLLLREQSKRIKNNPFQNLAIGKNIQDHTNLRINVLTNHRINSLNEISGSLLKKVLLFVKHLCGKSTLMTGTGATSAAHLDLDGDGEIDTRIQILQFSESGRFESNNSLFSTTKPGFSISITVIKPESKGEITLNGESNFINPMYLNSKADMELLKLALKFCTNLLKSDFMNEHILDIEDQTEIENSPEKYILKNFHSGYHLIGGTSDAINSNFKVHNTQGLFVCDASIFQEYAASNIHSSVVLIADNFAKKFINQNTT